MLAAITSIAVAPEVRADLLPRVMAAAGDSITRAFDIGWCCVLRDEPSRSWSSGEDSSVSSHYQRLLAFDQPLRGNAYNVASSGAKMRDLAGQLAAAASQGADYVTIEMGANDLCTSSASTMTPTSTFATQFRTALAAFVAARPNAHVFVASIPDLHRLWDLLHTNVRAQSVWNTFGICPSMLRIWRDEADRQRVVAQEAAYNETLRTTCAAFDPCRWDGYAVYNTQFSAADVSTVDYFHPSTAGQNHLAAVTWAAGFWAGA